MATYYSHPTKVEHLDGLVGYIGQVPAQIDIRKLVDSCDSCTSDI